MSIMVIKRIRRIFFSYVFCATQVNHLAVPLNRFVVMELNIASVLLSVFSIVYFLLQFIYFKMNGNIMLFVHN